MRALSLLFVTLLGACATPLSPEFKGDAARMLIVAIEPPCAGCGKDGSGILIGADAQNLYVLTARHVIENYEPQTLLKVRSALWPEHDADAAPRVYDLGKDQLELPDIALLSVPRYQAWSRRPLPEPFWEMQALEPVPATGEQVSVLGKHHGFAVDRHASGTATAASDGPTQGPARLKMVGDRPDIDEFVVEAQTEPSPGDSGGGTFDAEWRLNGMYPGGNTDKTFRSIRIDRVIERIRGLEASKSIDIRLSHRRPTTPVYVAWIGLGVLGAGAVTGIAAFVVRRHYYKDPTSDDTSVSRLNVAADVLMATGAAIDVYAAVAYLRQLSIEAKSRKAWKQ